MKKFLLPTLILIISFSCIKQESQKPGASLAPSNVINGELAGNKFPAIVALTDITGDSFCSGTLIAPDLVLTAAHCILDDNLYAILPTNEILIFKGSKTSPVANDGKYIHVKKVTPHTYYNPDQRQYDIALLELSSPFEIAPEDIPQIGSEDDILWQTDVIAVGFGQDELRNSGVKKFKPTSITSINPRGHIGVGTTEHIIYDGDSGSGLLHYDKDGRLTLLGVASYGMGIITDYLSTDYFIRAHFVPNWIESIALVEQHETLRNEGRITEATQKLHDALDIYEDNGDALIKLAFIELYFQSNPSKAMEYFSTMLDHNILEPRARLWGIFSLSAELLLDLNYTDFLAVYIKFREEVKFRKIEKDWGKEFYNRVFLNPLIDFADDDPDKLEMLYHAFTSTGEEKPALRVYTMLKKHYKYLKI